MNRPLLTAYLPRSLLLVEIPPDLALPSPPPVVPAEALDELFLLKVVVAIGDPLLILKLRLALPPAEEWVLDGCFEIFCGLAGSEELTMEESSLRRSCPSDSINIIIILLSQI